MAQDDVEAVTAAIEAVTVAVEKVDAAKAAATTEPILAQVNDAAASLRSAQLHLERVTSLEVIALDGVESFKITGGTAGMVADIRGDNTTEEPPIRRPKPTKP